MWRALAPLFRSRMDDVPRDMFGRACFTEFLSYSFGHRNPGKCWPTRPNCGGRTLPCRVVGLMQAGSRFPSSARAFASADTGDRGLFESKSPIVLLDQAPKLTRKVRNNQIRQ